MDRKIRAFLAVADTGKISDAAEKIALSQPAVTKTIKRLEDEMGTKLFERHAGGMDLTEAGQIFRLRAENIRMSYQSGKEEIRNLDGAPPKSYRIYAGSAYYLTVVPQLIRTLMSEYPETKFTFKFALSDRSVPDITTGEVDLVLGAHFGSTNDGVVRRPLFEYETIPYACKENPITASKPAPTEILAKSTWLTYAEDSHLKRFFADFFVARGYQPPKFSLEFTSLLTAFLILPGTDFFLPAPSSIRSFALKLGIVGLETDTPFSPVISGVSYRELARHNPITTRALELLETLTKKENLLI